MLIFQVQFNYDFVKQFFLKISLSQQGCKWETPLKTSVKKFIISLGNLLNAQLPSPIQLWFCKAILSKNQSYFLFNIIFQFFLSHFFFCEVHCPWPYDFWIQPQPSQIWKATSFQWEWHKSFTAYNHHYFSDLFLNYRLTLIHFNKNKIIFEFWIFKNIFLF